MWLADMFTARKQELFLQLFDRSTQTLLQAARALESYAAEGKVEFSDECDRLEKEGDVILASILDALADAFITPFDRQDIYYLAVAIDDMTDYINNAAREMKSFGVATTPQMTAMIGVIVQGAKDIRDAVLAIRSKPDVAVARAASARMSENQMENLYRSALADLFNTGEMRTIFKLREIYRHLGNSADQADAAGRQIGKMAVKVA
jgi:uncharacterized protein Yka (UPF0111/DUF47 family)